VKINWKAWLAAAAAIVILLALARILMNHVRQTAGPATPKTVVAQTVARVKKQPALALTGSIEAVQEAVVSAKVAGRVASVPVKNGDAVSSGQALVLLEDSDYLDALAASQASLDKAQANLETERDTYQRQKALYDSGAISASDLEGIKTSLALAQADADSAAAAVDSAREALQETSICSPISGVAANLDVEVGEFLTPGAPPATSLLNVEDISSVYAVVNVEQGDLAAVKPGLAARVTTDAYGDRVFNGAVEIINPVADSATRVFETKIRVANGDQLLRPGMFVNVAIDTGAPVDVLAVPQNAVVSTAGLNYVFVVEGNRVKRQQAQVGQVIGQSVEITSGLADGQQIVLTDVDTLNDGDQVTTQEESQ
jgi:RND family efflux transporter MFP subunit